MLLSSGLSRACCVPRLNKAHETVRLSPVRISAQPKEVFPGTGRGLAPAVAVPTA